VEIKSVKATTVYTINHNGDEYFIINHNIDNDVACDIYKEGKKYVELDNVDSAFGWLSNHLLDKYKIGEIVTISLANTRGVHEEYTGTIVVNSNWNNAYPYKIKMADGATGVFSEAEIIN